MALLSTLPKTANVMMMTMIVLVVWMSSQDGTSVRADPTNLYAVACSVVNNNETDCIAASVVINAQLQDCSRNATGGKYNGPLQFQPAASRQLRTTEAYDQEQRRLACSPGCASCVDCRIQGCQCMCGTYCANSWGCSSNTCTCKRRLDEEDVMNAPDSSEQAFWDAMQDDRRLNPDDAKHIGQQCTIAIRQLAHDLNKQGNYCLGDFNKVDCVATTYTG